MQTRWSALISDIGVRWSQKAPILLTIDHFLEPIAEIASGEQVHLGTQARVKESNQSWTVLSLVVGRVFYPEGVA